MEIKVNQSHYKPGQALRGSRRLRLPDLQDSQHIKVVRLSTLHTDRLYPPGNIPGTHFYWKLSQPQGHSAGGSIMSMKNFIDTIWIRTCDLPTCSAVSQPTAPPRTCSSNSHVNFNPLKPELNPICYLLALLAHHFLHVSRIRVKLLTLR